MCFRGGGSPELAEIGHPGVNSTRAWVRDDQRSTRDPPKALAGLCRARGGVCNSGGGPVLWSSLA